MLTPAIPKERKRGGLMRYYCKICGAWPLKARRMCRKCYDAKRYQDNKEYRLAQQHEWIKANPNYHKEYYRRIRDE